MPHCCVPLELEQMIDRAEGSGQPNRPQHPVLAQREAGQIVRQIPLQEELRIGRAADNDLVLAGTTAARHHVRVYKQDDHYYVANVGNGHSTWVNGIALIGQRRLRPGDRILIGDTELIYQPGNGVASPNAGSPAATAGKIAVGPTERGPQAEKAAKRRLSVALTPAGIVLVVALVLLALYWLAPGVFQAAEPTSEPTATAAASASTAASAAATASPPTPSPTAPAPTETAGPRIAIAESSGDKLASAAVLARRSKFEDAIDIYQQVAREAPDDPDPEIGWAWALILDGFPDQALLHARRAGELAPAQADAAIVLHTPYWPWHTCSMVTTRTPWTRPGWP
jgi:tetratricopeptide (TPR) repeat protein